MSILWSDRLKIGVPVIDGQHKALFDCQQNLARECQKGLDSGEVLSATLDFLETYVRQHFADEEDFMHRHDCEKIESHIEEHKYFIRKVEQIRQEYQEKGVSKNLIWFVDHYLLHWITTHIMSFDQTLKFCSDKEPL